MTLDKILCSQCRPGKHTKPPYGSLLCQCGERTCACYGIRIALGVTT